MDEIKKTCHVDCIFFPQEPTEIYEEKIINGVKQRKVKRLCLYDLKEIKDWCHKCPRASKKRR